jgi:HAD superfamily hydrolase (TIGR01509 family)
LPDDPTGPRSLKAVLFDMDGTLVDTEEPWWKAVESVAATLKYELTDTDLPDVLGRPVEHTAGHLRRATGAETSLPTLATDLHRAFAIRVEAGVVPRPGAVELLGLLHRHRVATAVVSASPRSIVEVLSPVLGPQRFAVTITADDTEHTKPAPDPYLAAARTLGVPPSACVAVEDSPVGVSSAEAAGCRVLAVPSLVPIAPAPGRAVLDSLEDADLALLQALIASRAPLPHRTSPAESMS